MSQANNTVCGVGLRITDSRPFRVLQCITGSPAYNSGKIRTGDILLSVDGISVSEKSIVEVSELIKGRPGSTVKMTFTRPPLSTQNLANSSGIIIPDLSAISITDFPALTIPDLSFTPGKSGWGAPANFSGFAETSINERVTFEVSMVRSNSSEAQKPGSTLMQSNQDVAQVLCRELNSARRGDKKASVPQIHCKNLKSSAMSTASDEGGYESKTRSACMAYSILSYFMELNPFCTVCYGQ